MFVFQFLKSKERQHVKEKKAFSIISLEDCPAALNYNTK